jgi:hypothetical protein
LSRTDRKDWQHYFEQRTSKLKRELVKALGLPRRSAVQLIQGDGKRKTAPAMPCGWNREQIRFGWPGR